MADYQKIHPVVFEGGVLVQPTTSKLADAEALAKDAVGYTHPNLHRRIDPQQPDPDSGEIAPRTYSINIYGKNSYRTTTIYTHDEDSTTSEIP